MWSLRGLVFIPRVLEELSICSCVVNVSKWMWTTCREDFSVFTSCRTKSPSMHLCPRWNRSVWDAERIKVNQTQRAGVVLMLRWLIVRVQPVPVLLGRFLPPSLAVICMHSGRRFVLQRRIWPKYNFKGDAPPSVSSAGRIFAEREAFIFVVRRSAYRFFCALWRILQFSSGVFCSRMFACVSVDIRQTGVGTEMWSSSSSMEKITGLLQSALSCCLTS